MHNAEQRRIELRYNGYFEKVQKLHMRLAATRDSANERVSTSFCSIFRSVRNSSITRWNASDSIAWFTLLKTQTLKWVENGETPQLAQNGKTISCTVDTLRTSCRTRTVTHSSSSLPVAPRSTDQSNYSRKLGPLLDPVTTRSDKHACGKPMLTDHDKQATENREPASEMNKEDPTQGIPVWLQPFTVNLEDLEYMCPHIPLKECTQIRKVTLQKWKHKKRKHSVHAYFRKNQKIYSAIRKVWCRARSSAKEVNLGTLTDTLSWHKFSPLNGIRVKPKTSQETEKHLRKFSKPSQKPKAIHTYILLGLGKYVEELSWNHPTTTLHKAETSGIAERTVRQIKEETSAVLLQSGSDDLWWSDSMKCCYCLQDVQESRQTGNLKYERRFEGRALFAAWIWEEDILTAEIEELKKFGCIRNISQKTECERGLDNPKRWRICISWGRWFSKTTGRDCEFQEPTLRREFTVRRESQRWISRR